MAPIDDGTSAGARHDDEAPTRQWRLGAYALCRREGEVLLVRASSRTEVEGRWFLPGGGVRFGEHPADAVVRELAEETGLMATEVSLRDVDSDVRPRRSGTREFTVRLLFDAVVDTTAPLVSEEGGTSDEARWVPLAELGSYPLVDYVARVLGAASAK
ncbi:MAG TPA: NUDIX domain-containing protein [Acidimicrobiales bacterium]|nr:NUDIX domain-containing protein [Acidimicrobiales bacterium]